MLFFVACAALLAAVAPIERRLGGLPTGLVTGALTSLGTLLLTALFVRWERIRLRDVGAAIDRRTPHRFATGLAIGLLLVAISSGIVLLAGTHTRWVRTNGVGGRELATWLLVFVLLSCREELAFHGYPLQRLKTAFGLWGAQSLVALVFALEHVAGGYSWTNAFLGAAVGSLLFGMAAIATRGLALPIGLHAAWNLGDWMRGGKSFPGIWHPETPEMFRQRAEAVGMAGYLIVMFAATFIFWRVYRRRPGSD